MTKHTPGEWNYGAYECADNADAIRICKEYIDEHDKPSSGWFWVVYVDDGRRTALVGHGPDGEANARLIGAAPYLLEACLAVLSDYACEKDVKPAYYQARAAIAKATGETK